MTHYRHTVHKITKPKAVCFLSEYINQLSCFGSLYSTLTVIFIVNQNLRLVKLSNLVNATWDSTHSSTQYIVMHFSTAVSNEFIF